MYLTADTGENILFRHINHCENFNVEIFAILFVLDFVVGSDFRLAVNSVFCIKFDILFVEHIGQAVGGCFEIKQSPVLCFFNPGIVIAVAVENDSLMLFYNTFYEGLYGGFKILCVFKFVRKLRKHFRNGGIEGGVGTCHGSGGAQHTKFKFISRKGKGGGSVPVRCVLCKTGENVNAHFEKLFLL